MSSKDTSASKQNAKKLSSADAGWAEPSSQMDQKMEATKPPVRYSAAMKAGLMTLAAASAVSMWGCSNENNDSNNETGDTESGSGSSGNTNSGGSSWGR